MVRQHVDTVLTIVLVALAVALVAGQLFGQPVALSYVTSDSMQPTLDAGDGFVAVPAAVAGEPGEGDVVVFEARKLHDGGLTTHRIVGETDGGYITKGDGNPFTDQDGPEPPVSDSQIVADALQVDGTVIAIPHLGTAIARVQSAVLSGQTWLAATLGVSALAGVEGLGLLLFGLGLALFVFTLLAEALSGPKRTRSRNRRRHREGVIDGRTVAILLLVALLLPANLAMIAPGGVHDVRLDGDGVAASEDVEPGEAVTTEYQVHNGGLAPIVFVFEPKTDGIEVPRSQATLPPGESATLEASVAAPPPGEKRLESVGEDRYLLVLPPPVLAALHGVHPAVARAAVNTLLAACLLGPLWALIGFGPIRLRGRRGAPIIDTFN